MKKAFGLAAYLLFFLTFFSPTAVSSECKNIIDEELSYEISFLFFEHAADATLNIRKLPKDNGQWYEAVLKAKTKGFVGLIAQYTEHEYRSLMRLDEFEKGRRFVSFSFAKDVVWGLFSPSRRSTRFSLNETKRAITRSSEIDGVIELIEEMLIPPKVGRYEDLLTAFYNLHSGFYGNLSLGREIFLHTVPFPKKYGRAHEPKIDHFVIRIATEKEKEAHSKTDGYRGNINSSTLVFIDVPAGLFDEKKAVKARVWTDICLIPTFVVVEDVMFFGDVVGRLKR